MFFAAVAAVAAVPSGWLHLRERCLGGYTSEREAWNLCHVGAARPVMTHHGSYCYDTAWLILLAALRQGRDFHYYSRESKA